MYVAEQLWALNAAWRDQYEYPHYIDMIDSKGKEEQAEADEREKQQVYEWLMGGDTT